MLELIANVTEWLAVAVEGAAAIIIGCAVLEAALRALPLFLPGAAGGGADGEDAKQAVRLRLGRWLTVALEFGLAADILRTATAPSWDHIGQLAAIAVLRTALNYFLEQEIGRAEARRAGGRAA